MIKDRSKSNNVFHLNFFKKIYKASVYERHNEKLLIPPLKNRFCNICFITRINYRELLLLKKYERSEFIVAFAFFGFWLSIII